MSCDSRFSQIMALKRRRGSLRRGNPVVKNTFAPLDLEIPPNERSELKNTPTQHQTD